MASPLHTSRSLPSILDRLIDPESGGTTHQPGYSVSQMIDTVRRDLEDLLNTRRSAPDQIDEFPELAQSVFNYGLPDLSVQAAFTDPQRVEIARLLESVIARSEPRLKEIRAAVVGSVDNKVRTIRFLLEAKLRLEPSPDVEFETVVELTTGRSTVTTRSKE